MAYLDPSKQYLSTDTQKLFGNQALIGGQNVSYGGQNYRITDNGNGTRSFQSVGGSAPSMGDMGGGFGGSTGGGYQNVINGQKSQEDQFNKNYSTTVNSQPSVSSLAEQYGNEAGLPGLQKSALDLTNTLANMPTTQANATRGFDVNEAQLQKIIASETNKLAPTVQNVLSSAQNAEGIVNQKLGYAMQDQENKLRPYEMQAKMMADRFAREMTGYSVDSQNELTSLLEKMREGFQMSENDKNRANDLAMQENSFSQAHDQAWQKFLTDENVRQYNATTAKTAGSGSYDIAGALNSLRNTKGTSITAGISRTPPNYAKLYSGLSPATYAKQPSMLQNLGNFFSKLF